ncbi:Lrp/AsnC family transcriptional regulator [Clostridium felsineum]|uniref:HTH-type transcriptional regulator LrpC n=1 Tax=Clostridium felsineum TaxID=36839 RepID=A0A1S8LQP9_9CLOT|nr:Lrp/AsnC family transcriptional regulator [Clostridium felsineum]URZ03989.1 HTH-type transcriptional regulator LrpC [Clostridium felsineum]URZ07753.1 HTH-type transcriptional regulator LrpC [Clostridium felsineum]URZ12784.1 HTH-type transcriptional regulator LrpC [Clostridium felsineum]
MLDKTDMEILNLLTKNSRTRWQEIGDTVHLTGQAVKNRVERLEKSGIIETYTIKINPNKIDKKVTAFITIFMKTTEHLAFQKYIRNKPIIIEAHRISGDGCYILKAAASQDEILEFLDEILKYGNYKINLSIENIK